MTSTSPAVRQTLGAFAVLWAFLGLPVILVVAIGVGFLLWIARLLLLAAAFIFAMLQLLTSPLRADGA